MLKPMKRMNMRNALIGALAREGVDVTPSQMDSALTWLAEGDARPDGIPESITVGGIVLAWPRGRETRVPSAGERNAWNTALKHVESNEVLTEEHNVRLYRVLFEALMVDLDIDPTLALAPPTVREVKEAEALVAAAEATPEPVIEHVVPADVNVSLLDSLMADIKALSV